MKKALTLTLIGASALSVVAGAAAAAAAAQPRHDMRHDRWTSINERQAELDRRIDRGIRSGQIDRREAYRLRTEFRDIARLENRYRHNGLSPRERVDLDRRFDRLAAQIRWERRDNQYGYGYGNGYRR